MHRSNSIHDVSSLESKVNEKHTLSMMKKYMLKWKANFKQNISAKQLQIQHLDRKSRIDSLLSKISNISDLSQEGARKIDKAFVNGKVSLGTSNKRNTKSNNVTNTKPASYSNTTAYNHDIVSSSSKGGNFARENISDMKSESTSKQKSIITSTNNSSSTPKIHNRVNSSSKSQYSNNISVDDESNMKDNTLEKRAYSRNNVMKPPSSTTATTTTISSSSSKPPISTSTSTSTSTETVNNTNMTVAEAERKLRMLTCRKLALERIQQKKVEQETLISQREQVEDMKWQTEREQKSKELSTLRHKYDKYNTSSSTTNNTNNSSYSSYSTSKSSEGMDHLLYNKACDHYRKQVMINYGFAPWLKYIQMAREKAEVAIQQYHYYLLLRHYTQWHGYTKGMLYERNRTDLKQSSIAVTHYIYSQYRSIFKAWKSYKKELDIKYHMIQYKHIRYSRIKYVWIKWRMIYEKHQRLYQQKLQKIERIGNRIYLYYILWRWKVYVEDLKMEKKIDERAEETWKKVQHWLT